MFAPEVVDADFAKLVGVPGATVSRMIVSLAIAPYLPRRIVEARVHGLGAVPGRQLHVYEVANAEAGRARSSCRSTDSIVAGFGPPPLFARRQRHRRRVRVRRTAVDRSRCRPDRRCPAAASPSSPCSPPRSCWLSNPRCPSPCSRPCRSRSSAYVWTAEAPVPVAPSPKFHETLAIVPSESLALAVNVTVLSLTLVVGQPHRRGAVGRRRLVDDLAVGEQRRLGERRVAAAELVVPHDDDGDPLRVLAVGVADAVAVPVRGVGRHPCRPGASRPRSRSGRPRRSWRRRAAGSGSAASAGEAPATRTSGSAASGPGAVGVEGLGGRFTQ